MKSDGAVGLRRRWSSHRVELLLALLVLVIAGPVIHEYKAQQASRYVFTAAMWDDGTIEIDRYAAADPPVLGIDRAIRDGHTYSDKAPLQPVLAIPFYASYRAVGGEPAIEARYDEHLGLWWVTFWMATVPSAMLAVMMYRLGRRFVPATSLPATLALVFGSILFPFSMLLFGHVIGALFLFAAFMLLATGARTPPRLLTAGLIAGAAVASEYTAAIGVIVLLAYAWWRARGRVAWFILGGVPAAAGLAWYHSVAFGSPLTHPYRFSAFTEVTEEARGFFDTFSSTIRLDNLVKLFFDGRGFLLASPIVVVGLIGLVMMVRRRSGEERAVALTSLLVSAAFVAIPVFWGNPWGGDSPGPRYLLPALPFLAVGVAAAWQRFALWARAATVVSVLVMGFAALTDPLLNDEASVWFGTWLQFAVNGDIVPTIFTIAVGPLGWVIHIGLAAWVGRALFVASRQPQSEPEPVTA